MPEAVRPWQAGAVAGQSPDELVLPVQASARLSRTGCGGWGRPRGPSTRSYRQRVQEPVVGIVCTEPPLLGRISRVIDDDQDSIRIYRTHQGAFDAVQTLTACAMPTAARSSSSSEP